MGTRCLPCLRRAGFTHSCVRRNIHSPGHAAHCIPRSIGLPTKIIPKALPEKMGASSFHFGFTGDDIAGTDETCSEGRTHEPHTAKVADEARRQQATAVAAHHTGASRISPQRHLLAELVRVCSLLELGGEAIASVVSHIYRYCRCCSRSSRTTLFVEGGLVLHSRGREVAAALEDLSIMHFSEVMDLILGGCWLLSPWPEFCRRWLHGTDQIFLRSLFVLFSSELFSSTPEERGSRKWSFQRTRSNVHLLSFPIFHPKCLTARYTFPSCRQNA